MTRTNKFLHGVSWGYINQLVLAGAGLYLTRFYLHRLGPPLYGLWIVGLQILAYLAILDLGIIALLPRETAYALGKDKTQLPRLIGETLSIALVQTPLLGLLAWGAWLLLPADWAPLRGPLAFTFSAFVLLFPLRAFGSVLQGLQDFKFLGLVHLCTWAVGTGTAVTGLYLGFGLYGIAIGWITTETLRTAAAYGRLRIVFPQTLPQRIPSPAMEWAKKRLSQSLWVTVSQVSQNLLVGADILILGKLLGPTTVVAYACTSKLVQILVNQPLMMTQSALPGLAELKSHRDIKAIGRVSEGLTLLVMIASGAIAAVLIAVNGGFVRWWVGDAQYAGNTLTVLLIANMLLRHFGASLIYSLFCFGHEKQIALVGLADGLTTVSLGLAFTPLVGAAGPMMGSLISGLFSVPILTVFLARDFKVTPRNLLRPLMGWAWRSALTVGVGAAILYHYPPRGAFLIAAVGVAMAAAYGLLMIPVIRSSVLLVYVKPTWDRTVGALLRRRAQ